MPLPCLQCTTCSQDGRPAWIALGTCHSFVDVSSTKSGELVPSTTSNAFQTRLQAPRPRSVLYCRRGWVRELGEMRCRAQSTDVSTEYRSLSVKCGCTNSMSPVAIPITTMVWYCQGATMAMERSHTRMYRWFGDTSTCRSSPLSSLHDAGDRPAVALEGSMPPVHILRAGSAAAAGNNSSGSPHPQPQPHISGMP
jgi:hypothetical protein